MKKNNLEIRNTKNYNTFLLEIKDRELRYWYMQKTIEEGWGRDTLIQNIKQEIHKREGKLISNFKAILGYRIEKG